MLWCTRHIIHLTSSSPISSQSLRHGADRTLSYLLVCCCGCCFSLLLQFFVSRNCFLLTALSTAQEEALASGGMTYHGSSSHGAQRRSLFPDAPVCITAGGLHCSHPHGRGMTEHLNGAVGIAGCSDLCRVGGAIQSRKAVPQDSIYRMSEGYRLCDPRMCGPRSCSSCHRRMTPKGLRSSWDEDSLSSANCFTILSHL